MGAFEAVEQKILCLAVQDAVRLASEGEVSGGYRCLLEGWSRVREFAQSGETWAGAVAAEYTRAIQAFEEMVNSPRALTYLEHQRLQFSGSRGTGMRDTKL
jgi:hypothetical protein